MQIGIEHAPHTAPLTNITGEGLQSLKNDPSVQSAQSSIVTEIRGDPKFGKQAFNLPDSGAEDFTANGPTGKWWGGALKSNQAFLMVHTANLHATNTEVTADGTTSTTWKVDDKFDYQTAWKDNNRTGLSYWTYNLYAQAVSPIYHGLLQAQQYQTKALWNLTIPPVMKSGLQE